LAAYRLPKYSGDENLCAIVSKSLPWQIAELIQRVKERQDSTVIDPNENLNAADDDVSEPTHSLVPT
jgi:hypothetical protein